MIYKAIKKLHLRNDNIFILIYVMCSIKTYKKITSAVSKTVDVILGETQSAFGLRQNCYHEFSDIKIAIKHTKCSICRKQISKHILFN